MLDNLPAPAEMRKLWVKALKSGEYKQTTHALREDKGLDDYGYCCLGVACDVLRKVVNDPNVARWAENGFVVNNDEARSSYGTLSDDVRNAFGLYSHRGAPILGSSDVTEGHGDLAAWNDNGATFAQIAKVLETNEQAFAK